MTASLSAPGFAPTGLADRPTGGRAQADGRRARCRTRMAIAPASLRALDVTARRPSVAADFEAGATSADEGGLQTIHAPLSAEAAILAPRPTNFSDADLRAGRRGTPGPESAATYPATTTTTTTAAGEDSPEPIRGEVLAITCPRRAPGRAMRGRRERFVTELRDVTEDKAARSSVGEMNGAGDGHRAEPAAADRVRGEGERSPRSSPHPYIPLRYRSPVREGSRGQGLSAVDAPSYGAPARTDGGVRDLVSTNAKEQVDAEVSK